jgi:hypothetical protein
MCLSGVIPESQEANTKGRVKVEYQKARDVIIGEGMDLELIHWNPNPKFLISKGVKRGTAKRVVIDIDYWVETTKRE